MTFAMVPKKVLAHIGFSVLEQRRHHIRGSIAAAVKGRAHYIMGSIAAAMKGDTTSRDPLRPLDCAAGKARLTAFI